METAEEIARKIFSVRVMTDWGNEDPTGKRREIFIGNLIQDMAKAILSERERFLKAVPQEIPHPESDGNHPCHFEGECCCVEGFNKCRAEMLKRLEGI